MLIEFEDNLIHSWNFSINPTPMIPVRKESQNQ